MSATVVIVSMGLPQLLACLDVEKRQGEENRREEQHRQILHEKPLFGAEIRATERRWRIFPAPKEILDEGALRDWKGVIKKI
jgi:hypothetical protein